MLVDNLPSHYASAYSFRLMGKASDTAVDLAIGYEVLAEGS